MLVDETEITITTAAEAERAKALDPIASPDAAKAHIAMTDAAFMCERLRTVLPRLQQRHREVAAQEYCIRWHADCDAVEIEQDGLAGELRERYPQVVQLADLFCRIALNDQEVRRIAAAAPAGEPRRLLGAELVARGLMAFSAANPSLASTLVLPDFTNAERKLWPPPQPSLASFVMPTPSTGLADLGSDWWKGREQQRAKQSRRST